MVDWTKLIKMSVIFSSTVWEYKVIKDKWLKYLNYLKTKEGTQKLAQWQWNACKIRLLWTWLQHFESKWTPGYAVCQATKKHKVEPKMLESRIAWNVKDKGDRNRESQYFVISRFKHIISCNLTTIKWTRSKKSHRFCWTFNRNNKKIGRPTAWKRRELFV